MARLVADRLGLEHVDGGTIFRSLAAERGMTLADFAALAEEDPSIDIELDERLARRASFGDVVLESRLAGWLASKADLTGTFVWIGCDELERALRVGGRDGHDHSGALDANRRREASERLRYLKYYDIDLADMSVYSLVVDSTTRGPEDLAAEVVSSASGRL